MCMYVCIYIYIYIYELGVEAALTDVGLTVTELGNVLADPCICVYVYICYS